MMTHDNPRLERLARFGMASVPVLVIGQAVLFHAAPDLAVETGSVPAWPALATIAVYYGDIACRRRPRLSVIAGAAALVASAVSLWWGGWEAGVEALLGVSAFLAAAIASADARAALLFGGSSPACILLLIGDVAVRIALAGLALAVLGWVALGVFHTNSKRLTTAFEIAVGASGLLLVAFLAIDRRARRAADAIDHETEP
jgi:hypothetical protein